MIVERKKPDDNERNEEELKKEELNVEELEDANGGLIVDRGFWSRYWIVSDHDGKLLDTAFFKYDAEGVCRRRTSSDTVISEEQYNDWIDRKNKGLPGPFTHLD